MHENCFPLKDPKKQHIVDRWTDVLQQYIGTEQSSDLQCAVAKVILHNAHILLVDSDNILGEMIWLFQFKFWLWIFPFEVL